MNSHIVITGASGSIGGALAREYAGPGITLHLHGRNVARLEQLSSACQTAGAVVEWATFDLRDRAAVIAWGETLDRAGRLDLVILNAGMNTDIGARGQGEEWSAAQAVVDINLTSTMSMVDAVLPILRSQQSGQIALVSSLAGYFGLPVTPAYCASKAGIKAYGEALRGWLAPEGIRVNVIMPGYVSSPMCDGMPGPKPFLWSPERAARVIRRGLARDKARISFPFPLNFGTWWLAVLPAALSQRIVGWLGYGSQAKK